MKTLVAIGISLCILPSSAHSPAAAEQETIRITRSGAQAARPALAESLTGSARVDAPFQASAPLRAQAVSTPAGSRSRPSQGTIGDFAPKLAQITDDVLYGDIWERPELSKRDCSLVTVAALIALNRPDQLRSHLRIARQNGLSQQELIETITHLAFYVGWPNAVTAIGVAREVFGQK